MRCDLIPPGGTEENKTNLLATMNYSKAQMVSVDAPTRVCYSNKATVG